MLINKRNLFYNKAILINQIKLFNNLSYLFEIFDTNLFIFNYLQIIYNFDLLFDNYFTNVLSL